MIKAVRRYLVGLGVILSVLISVWGSAAAQDGQNLPSAVLFPPELENFPVVTTYLGVEDPSGVFLPGLKAEDVRILEDSTAIAPDSFIELQPGVQFVMAITPGTALGIRDGQGVSRYDILREALQAWALKQPQPSLDDFSLVIGAESLLTHSADAAALNKILADHPFDPKNSAQGLQALAQALELVDNPSPRTGMGRAILYITGPQPEDAAEGLENLVGRARQMGSRIFVWFVASPELFASAEAARFREVARQTGGQFFAYSRDENLPDIETYLTPLRCVYRLVYTSQVKTSGIHTIAAEATTPFGLAQAASRSFEITVLPPNPIFMSPPEKIARVEGSRMGDAVYQTQAVSVSPEIVMLPETQTVQIWVEFPDGYPRPLVASVLYVDGIPVLQNTAPPFDSFSWSLLNFTEDGDHQLRVEVVDSLGLIGATIDWPVEIVIQRKPPSLANTLSRQGILVLGVVVVVTVGSLGLVLVLGGRVRPKILGQPAHGTKAPVRRLRRSSRTDPVTQPVLNQESPRSFWSNRLHWPQRHSAPTADALLVPIADTGEGDTGELPRGMPIPLLGMEITFGRSPAQATIVLDHPSVEDIHTRLEIQSNEYWLHNESMTAGTWLNYSPVPVQGALVQHGDIIHIGSQGFRFSLRKPAQFRKPVILREEKRRDPV